MSEDIVHPVFGTMKYIEKSGYVVCESDLIIGEETVRLNISALNRADAVQLLDALAPRSPAFADTIARAKYYAAQRLLETKNENWYEQDGSQISEQDFVDRLTTDSLSIHSDGLLVFGFDDGDLFYGHYVQVTMRGDDTFTDATFAG